MGIVKLYNKERDVTYVYESYSYWDKEKKQPRSKRKLIGKIDPETGDIVPTSPHRKKSEGSEQDYEKLYTAALKEISIQKQRIADLEDQLKTNSESDTSFLQALESAINEHRSAIKKNRHG